MISQTKDSIANVTTIAAAGSAMMDWTSVLTITLVVTGIVLNVIRIIVYIKLKKED